MLSLATESVEVFASTDHDPSADFTAAIAALDLQSHIHWVRGDESTANGFGYFNLFPLPESVVLERDLPHLEPSVAQIVARARDVAPEAIIQRIHQMSNTHAIGYWGPSSASTRAPARRVHGALYAKHEMVTACDGTEPAQNGTRRSDRRSLSRHALPLRSIAFTNPINPIFVNVDRDQAMGPARSA